MEYSELVKVIHSMYQEELQEQEQVRQPIMGFVQGVQTPMQLRQIFSRSSEIDEINRRCIERFQQDSMSLIREEDIEAAFKANRRELKDIVGAECFQRFRPE